MISMVFFILVFLNNLIFLLCWYGVKRFIILIFVLKMDNLVFNCVKVGVDLWIGKVVLVFIGFRLLIGFFKILKICLRVVLLIGIFKVVFVLIIFIFFIKLFVVFIVIVWILLFFNNCCILYVMLIFWFVVFWFLIIKEL